MNLTTQLKSWLIEHADCKSGATDDEFRSAAGLSLATGALTPQKFAELTTTPDDEKASETQSLLKSLVDSVNGLKGSAPATKAPQQKAPTLSVEKALHAVGLHMPTDIDEEKDFDIRVKEAAELYSTTKSTLTYPEENKNGRKHFLAGQPVRDFSDGGRVLESASDLDMAVTGAFSKFIIESSKTGRAMAFQKLPQHDKELLCYAMEKMNWGGASDGGDRADIKNRRLRPEEQKALIDDAASGGLEAAPIVFDDMVIQTPLLHGELFPKVSVYPLDRGRRVEGVSTGTVTASWGGVDDTAISLFNTASYVSAFDTTIYRWEGAIRIGLDFMSDTPIDFGTHITQQYGERLLEDLDDVIAVGNGTTQPEGVMNKSGTTSVSFGGSTSLGNYESLRFGVAKSEHRGNLTNSAVFCGTETSYQRARAIPVGSSDARRLGGMDYSSYRWMERQYAINESLSNQQIFYAILGRYRMYRRRGLTMRTTREGDTLVRRNEMLITAMARFGGQLERGAVAAVTTDAPA